MHQEEQHTYHHFHEPLNINVTITQKQDERVTELEKQMDSWLARLDKDFKKLEEISKQVDSK